MSGSPNRTAYGYEELLSRKALPERIPDPDMYNRGLNGDSCILPKPRDCFVAEPRRINRNCAPYSGSLRNLERIEAGL